MVEQSISHWGIHDLAADGADLTEVVEPHQRFSVLNTSYLRSLDHKDLRQECFAVGYQEAPRRNGDGSTTYSVILPLMIVTMYMQEQRAIAERVAAILNAHWDEVSHG